LTQGIPGLGEVLARTGGKGIRKAENRPSALESEVWRADRERFSRRAEAWGFARDIAP
jgi:hypothetical protein